MPSKNTLVKQKKIMISAELGDEKRMGVVNSLVSRWCCLWRDGAIEDG